MSYHKGNCKGVVFFLKEIYFLGVKGNRIDNSHADVEGLLANQIASLKEIYTFPFRLQWWKG